MAIGTAKEKKDEITGEDLVYSEKEGDYVPRTMSSKLYKQKKKAQTRKAVTAGAAGLVGEGLQYAIGLGVLSDPAVQAAGQEKARLKAEIAKGPDLLTAAEKSERRQAALAPVERRAEAVQRRAEAVAASTGDVSVRTLLRSGETGIGQIRQQALKTEAQLAAEDVGREQLKKKQEQANRDRIASIDAMMLDLRNKYVREPLHKFIGSAGKYAGTLMAYAPAPTIDDEVERLRAAEVPDEEISEFVSLYEKKPRKGKKAAEALLSKYKKRKPDTDLVDEEVADPEKPEEIKIDFKSADEYWAGKQPEDGTDFRTWARENHPEVKQGDKNARLDPRGPLTSPAFKNAWNKHGEEYLTEKAQAEVSTEEQKASVRERAIESSKANVQRSRQATLAKYDPEEGEDKTWSKLDKDGSKMVYEFEPTDERWLAYRVDSRGKNQFGGFISVEDAYKSKDPAKRELYDLALREGYGEKAQDLYLAENARS